MNPLSLDIAGLKAAYAAGILTPSALAEEILRRTADDPNRVWIRRLSDAAIRAHAKALEGQDPASLPLYGIPFAIKDNIDLAGVPTTAGCREFAYTPDRNAFVAQRLMDAGAIPIGKTNLDQFATGLNGTRSPFGACRNAFNPDFISGGSSSGSAVAVALGYCSFSLGTDTAGSGRVPAAFNHIVGHKPSLGWLSSSGLVPACRSLDTISVFALSAEDAEAVMTVAAAYDPADAFSRPPEGHGFDFGRAAAFRVGIPRADQLNFFGNAKAERLFGEAVVRIRALGGECVEFDLQPFLDTARLLYDGPWVAERYAAIRDFFDTHPEAPLPVIREIVGGSKRWSAADAYEYGYRLMAAKRRCDALLGAVDCVLMPTAGTVYTIAELEADPIRLNGNLGWYTNFMNLLDYAATAVPAGFQSNGLPFGVTLFAQRGQDGPLLRLAARMQRAATDTAGRVPLPPAWTPPRLPGGQVRVAVVGAHLSGLPLNGQLLERGARLLAVTRTAPKYRFYALPDGKRPGLIQVKEGGAAIACEVWEMAAAQFGGFVAGIPAPLGIGKLELEDGAVVNGFICEGLAVADSMDITGFGGWRAWLAARAA
jgi:allophanate hydrolase